MVQIQPQKVESQFRCIAFVIAGFFGLVLFLYVLGSVFHVMGSEKVVYSEQDKSEWGNLPDFLVCANYGNKAKWAFYDIWDYSYGGGERVGLPKFVPAPGIIPSTNETDIVKGAVSVSIYAPALVNLLGNGYETCVKIASSSLSPQFPSRASSPGIAIDVSYEPGTCEDINGTALDANGNACEDYDLSMCNGGTFDDIDFVAATMCCACGGGVWSLGIWDPDTIVSFDIVIAPMITPEGKTTQSKWLASVNPVESQARVAARGGFRIEKSRHRSGLFGDKTEETYALGSSNYEYTANWDCPETNFVSSVAGELSATTDPEDENLYVAGIVLSFDKQTVALSTEVPWQWRAFRIVGHSGGYFATIGAVFALVFVRKYPYSEVAITYEELTLRGCQSRETDVELNAYKEGFLSHRESDVEISDAGSDLS